MIRKTAVIILLFVVANLFGMGISNACDQSVAPQVEFGFCFTSDELLPPANVMIDLDTCTLYWDPPESTSATLLGYNLYQDGELVACEVDTLEYMFTGLVAGQTYVVGVSAVYEEGESYIVELVCWGSYILNPPTNADFEIMEDHVLLTWEEPEPGSTYPLVNYRIYVDGEMYETENTFYEIYGLIDGQTYEVGLSALYEYGFESQPIVFEITVTDAEENDVQPVTALTGNYPNPFNPETTILFILNTENTENTEIVVYNVKGQRVKTLVNKKLAAGNHSVVWNGKDENGRNVASGIYFYRMTCGEYIKIRKMMLIK